MSKVPIVRTEGKDFGVATLTPERLAQRPSLLRESKTPDTRDSEAGLGLGDSLYFFVGHACPDFGHVVLVYDPDWSVARPGTATPFDTGGLWAGHIVADGVSDETSRRDYCDGHKVSLCAWQDAFSDYLSEYFDSARAYVLGERAVKDDSSHRLLHPDNERRGWTWELQVEDDHPALQDLKHLCLSSMFYDALQIELDGLAAADAVRWQEALDATDLFVAPAATEAPLLCRVAEERIVGTL